MTKYGNNDYKTFLSLADDAESLQDLSDTLCGSGLEGTPYDSMILEGKVNSQYEIIRSGNALMIYDHDYKERVFITDRENLFIEMIDEEIKRRCGGFDYDTWTHLEYMIANSD